MVFIQNTFSRFLTVKRNQGYEIVLDTGAEEIIGCDAKEWHIRLYSLVLLFMRLRLSGADQQAPCTWFSFVYSINTVYFPPLLFVL